MKNNGGGDEGKEREKMYRGGGKVAHRINRIGKEAGEGGIELVGKGGK